MLFAFINTGLTYLSTEDFELLNNDHSILSSIFVMEM